MLCYAVLCCAVLQVNDAVLTAAFSKYSSFHKAKVGRSPFLPPFGWGTRLPPVRRAPRAAPVLRTALAALALRSALQSLLRSQLAGAVQGAGEGCLAWA